jgi:uncharacterized membrane protein
LLSAIFAAVTVIFAKLGVAYTNINSDLASPAWKQAKLAGTP